MERERRGEDNKEGVERRGEGKGRGEHNKEGEQRSKEREGEGGGKGRIKKKIKKPMGEMPRSISEMTAERSVTQPPIELVIKSISKAVKSRQLAK